MRYLQGRQMWTEVSHFGTFRDLFSHAFVLGHELVIEVCLFVTF